MPGLGSITTTLITTRGLFTTGEVLPPGFTALTLGAGLTPWFRLYISDYTPPLVEAGSNGGSRVYQPGEYAQSWKPVDPVTGRVDSQADWFVVPRDKEAEYFNKGKIVTIKLVWNNKEYDKTYSVTENNAKRIVEVVNFVNASKERIKVAVSGVKTVASTALVEVRNLVLRRKRTK